LRDKEDNDEGEDKPQALKTAISSCSFLTPSRLHDWVVGDADALNNSIGEEAFAVKQSECERLTAV
jgi:hypothetical protein